MFVLSHDIKIAGKRFHGIESVEIKKQISNLSSTATIKVPATAVLKKTDGTKTNILIAEEIKRGDRVEIDLGYNGANRREFTGYVNRINYTQPIEIECQDASFRLRELSIQKRYTATEISVILKDILEGTGIEYTTEGLSLRTEKLNLATDAGQSISRLEALRFLIDRYCLTGYFDNDEKLFFGLRQGQKTGEVKLRLGWNTIKDDELKYHQKDEQRIKITAVYIDRAGVRKEVKVGDDTGESRTIFLTDVKDSSKLKELATQELEKLKFDGFAGKITAFLTPYAEPGFIIRLQDEQYNERSGSYYCEGTEVEFGTSGARRKIIIGAKV